MRNRSNPALLSLYRVGLNFELRTDTHWETNRSTTLGKYRPILSLKLLAFLRQRTIFQTQVFCQLPHYANYVVSPYTRKELNLK